MVNFKHTAQLPFKETLSPEDNELISQIASKEVTRSATNRLTFRLRRTMDGTRPSEGFSENIDFRKEFPMLSLKQIYQVNRYFELKGIQISPTGQPQTFRYNWEHV